MSKFAPMANHKPKLLILASRPADFKSAIGYLRRRDYEVDISESLSQAIESVAAGTCDYLLLSIDFPNSRAEILPQVLEQTFNVAVIVFAEKQDRRTTQRLGSLKARNILFSQPSGPSIHARIKQVWVATPTEREAKRKQATEAKAAKNDEKFLTPQEVANQLLELLNRTLVQQPSTPDFVTIEGPPKSNEFSTTAPAVISRFRKKRPNKGISLDDYGNPISRPVVFETKVHEAVWDTVDKSLKDVCPSDSKLGHMMGPVTEAELMCIDSMNFKGTFVIAYSGDEGSADASPLVAAESKLIEDLKERGYHIRDEDVKVLPMFDFDIPTKLLNSAEIVVTHTCRQFDVSFAYYSSTRLIPIFETATEDPMLTVDIGQFVPGSVVNVDIFLPMPLNKKFVRYWRRGSEVTEEQLTKVASHGAVQLSVRKDQADLFSQYCAYQAIKAEVARIESIRALKKRAS